MSTSGRPRLLLAITVYNGRTIVPRCLHSAARLSTDTVDVDVLVLDDASPDVEFSREIEELCAELGLGYYRTPRNLGIVRNVNLGMLRARAANYDGVIISNSDVIYSQAAVERLWAVTVADATIGASTAWSNNVSVYSLPNADPDAHLATQEVVDEVGDVLAAEFGTEAVDIPAGISFFMLITQTAMHEVGLMDPVFGRGYCEETDWSRRCLRAGLRLVLAPGVFVYHAGQGSTAEAGMLSGGHTTVPANERVIDLRYPDFRDEVGQFVDSGVLEALWARGGRAIVRRRARATGYSLDVSVYDRPVREDDPQTRARLYADSTGLGYVTVSALGFHDHLQAPCKEIGPALAAAYGEAGRVTLHELGPAALAATLSVTRGSTGEGREWTDARDYPEQV